MEELETTGASTSRLDPLPGHLRPEVREFAEALRAVYEPTGLSLRDMARREGCGCDHTTIHRYLKGERVPSKSQCVDCFVDAAGQAHRANLTDEVVAALRAKQEAALRVSNTAGYELFKAMQALKVATIERDQARRLECAARDELERERGIRLRLERELHELETAADAQQLRSQAELALAAEDNARLRRQLADQRRLVEALQEAFDNAVERRGAAESRHGELEQAVTVLEQADGSTGGPKLGLPQLGPVPPPGGETGGRPRRRIVASVLVLAAVFAVVTIVVVDPLAPAQTHAEDVPGPRASTASDPSASATAKPTRSATASSPMASKKAAPSESQGSNGTDPVAPPSTAAQSGAHIPPGAGSTATVSVHQTNADP